VVIPGGLLVLYPGAIAEGAGLRGLALSAAAALAESTHVADRSESFAFGAGRNRLVFVGCVEDSLLELLIARGLRGGVAHWLVSQVHIVVF
jgi:hypothetical protein